MKLLNNYSLGNHYYFLDSGSYIMDGIVALHDHILYYEIIVTVVVMWMIFIVLVKRNNFSLRDLIHGSILEIIWTIIPGIILIFIALPSFRLLYLMDDVLEPSLTIKVIGHQWYWSYSYDNNEFDSYPVQDLVPGSLRNLETDEHLILPSNTNLRILVTSTDVIHSWALPSLGVKMDAIPGRINQIGLEIYRAGLYYGQCSELCGINHSYMPITIRVI